MKKVIFVATVVKTHIMEFHIPYLKMFKKMGWQTAVAARNDYENSKECNIPYCDFYYDIPFERNPLKIINIKAYKMIKKLFNENNYNIIHCHTPAAALLTRLAAVNARKNGSKIIYTAHGLHFYKGAPLLNWLVYYPVERWLSAKTDVLITINKEDFNRAKYFEAKKTVYVPGVGIDINRFERDIGNRNRKREELGLSDNTFVILSVGELNTNKNHVVVLDALGELKRKAILSNIHYLVCGEGPLKDVLEKKAFELNIAEHVSFLGYRNDINDICNLSDLFVFMSLREGLPVALMEAMASGLPVICSNVRGNRDLVESGKNGEIVDNNCSSLANAIIKLKDNDYLRREYVQASKEKIKYFDLGNVQCQMYKVYMDALFDR